MRIVAHPSPLVLEEELCRRVAAAKAGDPLAPALIVVPSRRLAEHVRRRLVERFGVVLAVEVVHHAALARQVLESAGVPCPRIVGETILETLTSLVARRAPKGRLADFAHDHPGAIAALRKSLGDLRDAGLAPEDVSRVLGREHAELASLYSRWTAALASMGERFATDHVGLAAMAVPHAEAFARRFRAIVHHGAYELIGVHTDLVNALDRGHDVVFLKPARRDEAAPTLAVAASFRHVQGATAELATAARGALAAVASGVPPHEVAVIVRSFGPYESAMDALLADEEVRWHTSYTRPLRREPAVLAALAAWRASETDRAATYGAHAAAFAAIAQDAAGKSLAPLIAAMADVENVLGETRPIPRDEAIAWLDARVDAATVPPAGADGGGVRILDAMQARGLTFRHVALVGMNAGIFPLVGREDPFLPETARERVMSATHRALPVAAARDAEEHLILSMVLGATRERLEVSWRRADEAGRPAIPSLALRDVAQATGRGTSVADLEEAAVPLPAHPRARLAAWASSPGLLRVEDETVLIALDSELGAPAAAAVAARLPALAGGVALVTATDSFAPGAGHYDGRVGDGHAVTRLGATALERLGACPLKFFFGDVLRVEPPGESPEAFEAEASALGNRTHRVLQAVYRALADERLFDGSDLAARILRAKELLPRAWAAHAAPEDAARAARLPVLDGIVGERWIAAIGEFVAADLARMNEQGVVPVAFETDDAKAIPGGPEGLMVKARFDRIVEGAGGRVIGDYKTGRKLRELIGPAAILSGEQLQVPVYALIEGAPVELLGVGPKHRYAPGEESEKNRFVRFAGFKSADHRAGFLETIGVLATLLAKGRFPLRSGSHCDYCDYRPACRRKHPPTEHREEHAPDIADVRDCWDKGDATPTLALVRAKVSS